MGQFEPKTRAQIMQRMVNRVVARSELNDLNDLSDIKQVLAAAAREDDDAYFQMLNLLDLFDIAKAIGDDLDERAKEFNPKLITRVLSDKATGNVRFSRAGTTGTVTIATGTQVTIPASGSQAEVVFSTTAEGTIANTFQQSGLVPVVAADAGTEGNAAVGAIKGFVAKPSGVDEVTNPSAFTNGRDRQSDDSFRDAVVNQIKGLARSHDYGLETGALKATYNGKQVLFANVVENPILRGNVTIYIDDGTGTAEEVAVQIGVVLLASALGGETVLLLPDKPIKIESGFVLYVNAVPQVYGVDYVLNPASGQINFLPASYPAGLTVADAVTADYTNFIGLIAAAQKIIDGDKADRSNFPGYRAGGVLVRVLTPQVVQIVVTVNITVLSGFNQTTVAASVKSAISSYINGLGTSDDVILNEMRERAMAVPGMFDVSFLSPTTNTVILDNQLARIIANNITIS